MDPASLATGILGVIGVAVQLTQIVLMFGLDWKDAPKDVRMFYTELQSLESISQDISKHLILNPKFRESMEDVDSSLLSAFQDDTGKRSSTAQIIKHCKTELQGLVDELSKRAAGGRIGWDRFKSAFLSKRTCESMQALDRRYGHLARLMQIDSVALSARIYKEIRDLKLDQGARHEEDQNNELLDWVSNVRFEAQVRDLLDRREQGTGKWLMDTPTFHSWEEGNEPQILLCQGIPGAGKTMLAASVIEYMEWKNEGHLDVGIAYFFCNFQRQGEQRLAQILSSLVRQLVERQGIIPESLRKLHAKYGKSRTTPSRQEMADILRQTVADFHKVYIIIDALDEYLAPDGTNDDLLCEIQSIHQDAGANMFLTSRVFPATTVAFEDSLSLEISAHEEDILMYAERRIQSSRLRRFPSLYDKIKKGILKAASGMFLLVELHMRTLQGQLTVGDIEDALDNLPQGESGLDETYAQAMQRIENQRGTEKLAKRVLAWLTHSRQPMSCSEFLHAVSIKAGVSKVDQKYVPEVQDLLSICAGLVTVDERNGIVRLVHYTVQKYFERTCSSWFPEGPREIETACLTYLSLDIFATGSCSTNGEFEARIHEHPFYAYACRNWGHHLLSPLSSNTGALLEKLMRHEDKVSACGQALLLPLRRSSENIQLVPTQVGPVHLAAYFGNNELIRAILSCGYPADQKDSFGQTPLMWAATYGHLDAILFLLGDVANVSLDVVDNSGQTALHHAIWNMHIPVVRALIKNGANITIRDQNGNGPLHIAADMNSHEVLVLLLYESGGDMQKETHEPVSPERRDFVEELIIHGAHGTWCKAVEQNDEPKVRLLLSKGVDLERRTTDGGTILNLAASRGNETIIRILLESGANPRIKGVSGRTALHTMIRVEDDKTELTTDPNPHASFSRAMHLLVQYGIDINAQDERGRTALYMAAFMNDLIAVQCLATLQGLDRKLGDTHGQTPLLVAAAQGNAQIVEFLMMKNDCDPNAKDNQGRTALICAADRWVIDLGAIVREMEDGFHDRRATVKLLLEREKVDINTQDLRGRTALICAVEWEEQLENMMGALRTSTRSLEFESDGVVQILLQHHARVNIADSTGMTALGYAVKLRNEFTTRLLMSYGARVDDKHLECAATAWRVKNVEALLEDGDNKGLGPEKWLATAQLFEVAKSGDISRLDSLLKMGADIEYLNKCHEPYTFWRLFDDNHLELFHFLVSKGVNMQTMKDYLPQAWKSGSQELVKAFLSATGPVSFDTPQEVKGFLHNSVLDGSVDFVRFMLDNGCNVKFGEQQCCDLPLLHLAVMGKNLESGRADMATLLLDRGANIEIQDTRGETALHLAIKNLGFIKLFVSRGASVEAKCHKCQTPLAKAVENGLTEAVGLLLKLGADPYNVNISSLTPTNLDARAGFVKAVRVVQSARSASINL